MVGACDGVKPLMSLPRSKGEEKEETKILQSSSRACSQCAKDLLMDPASKGSTPLHVVPH